MPTPTTTIEIKDRNEAKALTAWGFNPTPSPDGPLLAFKFAATEDLFEARRA